MLKKPSFQLFYILSLLFILAFLWGCDDDKPNGPVEPKDYPVYFCDPVGSPPELFTFYPIARRVDSIDLNWLPVTVMLSADGKILYFNNEDSYLAVNAADMSVIAELPGYVWGVSSDNRFIAVSNNGVKILRTSDYSVFFEDSTVTAHSGVFTCDGKRYYSSTSNRVYRVDLSDSNHSVTQFEFTDGGVVQVIPSIDETKLFLYIGIRTWLSAFEVYDILEDSIIFRDYLVPGYGHMAISPNGKYVFYTNPGRSGTDPSHLFGFIIFDVEANQIDRVVVDTNFFTGPNWGAPPGLPVVTPDSRWLVMLGGILNYGILYLYDIQTGELVHREDWGGYGAHLFTPSLAVQYIK
ncbi:MAG: hypothetical protein JXA92_00875 [candidate division Zixibacteria bacterium]|nr:hypothetical protein [candidate division Zixibacteria bacterium]